MRWQPQDLTNEPATRRATAAAAPPPVTWKDRLTVCGLLRSDCTANCSCERGSVEPGEPRVETAHTCDMTGPGFGYVDASQNSHRVAPAA